MIRWALSHDCSCIKEPCEGRGLLVTWDPEFREADNEIWDYKPETGPHGFGVLDGDLELAGKLAGESLAEWTALGLPRTTFFVAYTAAPAAGLGIDAQGTIDGGNFPSGSVSFIWRHWIEKTGSGWMLHLPGRSAGKLGYESKRMASQFKAFMKSWKPQPGNPKAPLCFTDGQKEYGARFAQVQEDIRAGNYYLANLTMHFGVVLEEHDELSIPPAELYLRLRRISPSPQGFFLQLDLYECLHSCTPERLFRVGPEAAVPRTIETCPIKGTRPVSPDPEENARRIASLVGSEKENAELSMIVDLERNDLSRVCIPGSVVLDGGFRVESTPHVHHRVATIRGHLRDGIGFGDIVANGFPGGSVTGAPKTAVVNALAKIERISRGPYCGSVFWVNADGSFDSSILIRTIFHITEPGANEVRFGTGGGITIDSDAGAEYLECFHKAAPMAQALEPWVDITVVRRALEQGLLPQKADWPADTSDPDRRRIGR